MRLACVFAQDAIHAPFSREWLVIPKTLRAQLGFAQYGLQWVKSLGDLYPDSVNLFEGTYCFDVFQDA